MDPQPSNVPLRNEVLGFGQATLIHTSFILTDSGRIDQVPLFGIRLDTKVCRLSYKTKKMFAGFPSLIPHSWKIARLK